MVPNKLSPSFPRSFFQKFLAAFLLHVMVSVSSADPFCEEKLRNCTAVMFPMLSESRYMFPINHMEVEGMCKIWSHIMDCIRKYMTDCSTEEQKAKFNEAVSDSIDSVHAICSSERYRRDYLENAICFKRVSMENCGVHFRKMVDSAYNPLSLESHICCSYSQYEKCVSEPIQRLCGPHTLHLMDHSMASLKSRCEIITQKLRLHGGGCSSVEAADQAPPSLNAISAHLKSPRVAVANTYSPLTTSSMMVSDPSTTTQGWTPRTIIYSLPSTRQSSRVARSHSETHRPLDVHHLVAIIVSFYIVTLGKRFVWGDY